MAYGDAKRKIYFHRIFDPDTGDPLNRQEVCRAIEGLAGEDAYFSTEEQGGLQISRAEVHSSAAPQCIRFFKVRRNELPGKDDGEGDQSDLGLDEREGLSEAIHIRLFTRGVLGIEAFGHGPRPERFGRYLSEHLDFDCVMHRLVRHDAIDEALQFGDIRLLRVKFNPSIVSHEDGAPETLEGLVQTADSFDTGVYADLTLRSEGNDRGFRNRVRTFLSNLRGGNHDGTELFEKLEVEGKPDPETPVASLDLLSERLYRTVEIPYRGGRNRELDADAAFSAVKEAYNEVKDSVDLDALD